MKPRGVATGGAGDPQQDPPRILERLAGVVLPPLVRDAVLGDLHERFTDRVRRSERPAATRWYARQVLGFLVTVPFVRAGAAARDLTRDFLSPGGWLLDVRLAARAVVRERVLTWSVVGVLALAVGSATTVFSVVSAVLLRPLPFAEPESLVMLWDEYPLDAGAKDPRPVTLTHFRAWQQRTDLFAGVGGFELMPAVIDAGRWPERVDAALVTAGVMQTLGARPAIGRLFTGDDDRPGAPAVAILSHELWQSVFGGDERLIGRTIAVDGEATEIIGVMPRDFWFYDPYAAVRSYAGASASAAKLWRPLAGRFADDAEYPRYRAVARLRPGVTRAAVEEVLGTGERQLPLDAAMADGRIRVVPLAEQITGDVRPRLLGLSAAVLLVLVIACVNLVSLLIARFDVRRTELAIRAALGAGRARIARGLLLHGAFLALAGAVAGACVAAAAIPTLLTLVPRGLPLAHRVDLDVRVIAFAMMASVTLGLLGAMLAAARLTRGATAWMAAGARSIAGRGHRGRLTALMTTGQVALSLVLLIAATMLLRSLLIVHRTDGGFDRRNTLTFQSLLMLSAPDAPPDFGFFDRLEARMATLPGVTAVGSATILPFSRWGGTAAVGIPARNAEATVHRVNYRPVSPGYFGTLRVDLLAGRSFAAEDRPGSLPVAIVNRAFAERHLAGVESVMGTRLVVTRGRQTERTVIGVVANVKENGLFADDQPILYVPIAQSPSPMRQYVVRSTAPDPTLVDAIREAAAGIDRTQPLQNFITLEALVGQSVEEERFYAAAGSAFAGIAVFLTLAGLYAAVSAGVRQRAREVGVRIALGATRSTIYRTILSDGMRPVAIGLLLGCIGGTLTTRLFSSLIHGLPPVDPLSYVGATMAFALNALVACLLPARRAAHIDPIDALKES